MSEYQAIAVVSAFVLAYSLIASRLEKTIVSGAVIYVAAGMLLGPQLFGLVDAQLDSQGISLLAEIALAICLFSDSANANLGVLRSVEAIPIRLLLIGLPLTITLGVGLAWLLFGELSLIEVALIGTMLAPTDAALGKAVVTNTRVPAKVRESLNVESGLNDGICVPIVLLFIAVAAGAVHAGQSAFLVISLPLQVIGIGLAVGLVLGALGSTALKVSATRHWVEGTWLQTPVIAMALLCFALAQLLGGSGFIASFVGGLTFGALNHGHKRRLLKAAEGTGDVVVLITWFAFGTMALKILIDGFHWTALLYALLSLTIVRMLPVALCLMGKKLQLDTVLFVGWFGPRGLASIVFLVMVFCENLPGNDVITSAVVWTILLSVLLHGLSANPLAAIYGRRIELRGGDI